MLCLSRKLHERIRIGGNVFVMVKSIDRNRVKLVFDAPPEVEILREELCDESHDDTEILEEP